MSGEKPRTDPEADGRSRHDSFPLLVGDVVNPPDPIFPKDSARVCSAGTLIYIGEIE